MAVRAELILGPVFIVALAIHVVAGVFLPRRARAHPSRAHPPWARGVWYTSGVLFVLLWGWAAVHWQMWNPRKAELGAFPLLFAVTAGLGYLSSGRFLRLAGYQPSLLPLPLQGLMVGIVLGSALTADVWGDVVSLYWLTAAFVFFIGAPYQDFFRWLWTSVVRPPATLAATALRFFLQPSRRP